LRRSDSAEGAKNTVKSRLRKRACTLRSERRLPTRTRSTEKVTTQMIQHAQVRKTPWKIASAALLIGMVMSACAGEMEESSDESVSELEAALTSTAEPSATGPFGACYYTTNLSRPQYAGARMFYPCAAGSASNAPIASGVFAASTLSPGYTNSSSAMFWLGQHLASHGFIVLAMAPDNVWGNNPEWRDAHVDAYNELIEENGRIGSPILGALDVNKIQIMGYSKGGGGALMAAQQLSSQGKKLGAVQALAPYYDLWSNDNLISAPVAIHGGGSDIVAPTGFHATPMFNGLATSTKRVLAIYSGLDHLTWVASSSSLHPRLKQYVTSWMKVYLYGDTYYQKYLNGTSHNASWFNMYTYVP
jgi:dienelactone hydrolase